MSAVLWWVRFLRWCKRVLIRELCRDGAVCAVHGGHDDQSDRALWLDEPVRCDTSSADVVWCPWVSDAPNTLDWVDREVRLDEARRVLRPGGRWAAVAPAAWVPPQGWRVVRRTPLPRFFYEFANEYRVAYERWVGSARTPRAGWAWAERAAAVVLAPA